MTNIAAPVGVGHLPIGAEPPAVILTEDGADDLVTEDGDTMIFS